jgi:competence protein ComEC
LLSLAGVGLLLLPRGLPGRRLAPALVLPLLLGSGRSTSPEFGNYRVHVLDVGQGLSVVVETADHLMVFDLGPRYRSGFETGSKVVVPFLRELGRSRVDLLVLSHSDIDHSGGLSGLLERFPQTPILAGEPRPGQGACVAGEHWDWDGVSFDILHPTAGHALSGNNASCVIRVGNSAGATLLTGDIESRVEAALVRRDSSARDLSLVLAPHHGSATSSSEAFVATSEPDFVVFTAGYRNRYGFPRPAVVERWRAIGARQLNTAVSGQISFEATQGEPLRLVREYRPESLRFWHSRQ